MEMARKSSHGAEVGKLEFFSTGFLWMKALFIAVEIAAFVQKMVFFTLMAGFGFNSSEVVLFHNKRVALNEAHKSKETAESENKDALDSDSRSDEDEEEEEEEDSFGEDWSDDDEEHGDRGESSNAGKSNNEDDDDDSSDDDDEEEEEEEEDGSDDDDEDEENGSDDDDEDEDVEEEKRATKRTK